MPSPNPSSWPLERWVDGFYDIYANHDDKRPYSELWLPATSHASKLAEAVRLNDYEGTLVSLSNVFAWLLSFAGRFIQDLEQSRAGREVMKMHGKTWTEWILHKYPGVCHFCGGSRCTCASIRDVVELRARQKRAEYESFAKKRDESMGHAYRKAVWRMKSPRISMPKLFDMFYDIYRGTLWGTSLSDIAYHFVEEIGEVSKEIHYLEGIVGGHNQNDWNQYVKQHEERQPRKWKQYYEVCTDVTRELADIFSWGTALCYKVHQLSKPDWQPRVVLVLIYTGKVELGGEKRVSVVVTQDKANFICRYCGKTPCEQDCPQKQITKRVHEGRKETEKRYRYENARRV